MLEWTQDEKNVILALGEDPVMFAKFLLDVDAFDYQAKFLRDQSNRIVVCAGRQVGKSFMTSARSIWYALTHEKTTTLIVSSTLRQSMLMFDKILSMVLTAPVIRKSIEYHTRTRIRFRNGSWIIALPCGRKGYTVRGFSADQIVVDEAAFVPQDVISQVILPMLATTKGRAILLSTPYDRDHVFFKVFSSPEWSKYHLPSSVNPLIPPAFLEEQLQLNGQLVYDQEYMAEFVDDARSYFPMLLLRPCIHACARTNCEYCGILSTPDIYLTRARTLFAGYDPGGKVDPSALVVVEKMETKKQQFRVVYMKTYLADRKKNDENLYTRFTVEISDLHQKYHFSKLMVDSTGLGSPIVEQCKSLKLPAEGVHLVQSTKEQILSNLRILLENQQLELPPNDLTLLSNLNCIESDRTAAGNFIFSHSQGTHDDLGYALALALWAATKPVPTVLVSKGPAVTVDQQNDSGYLARLH